MSFLNKKIISLEPKIIGLDLSDLSVKVFQLEKDGKRDIVRGYGSVDIPSGNIEDGRIVDKAKVVESIKAVLKSSHAKKINTNKVICSLPESKAFVRIITIPKMSEEEAREAVKWEMEANMPMSLDDVYFDWQFLQEEGDCSQKVLTAAVSREVIDDWMETLELAGLDVYGLEIESMATARSLVDENMDKDEASLIVDIGARRTSFIIAEGAVPYFTSSIPFSSEGINDTIIKCLKMSSAEAEKAKISNGIEKKNNPIFKAVEPLMENLVVEITKTMDFYREMSKKSQKVKRIILCGGGANMKGLAEYVSNRIKSDVVMGTPWVNVNLGNNLPIIKKDESVRYATVIGLAIHALNYEG